MRDVDVVVLSKYPEIFEGFKESVDQDAPELVKRVVWDSLGGISDLARYSHQSLPIPWQWMFGGIPFKISANANLGFSVLSSKEGPQRDFLYCGDDTRIIEPDTIKRLRALAYSDPEIGILSPSIIGHCAFEMLAESPKIMYCAFVGFVFVYIKREVIEKIGYLDERFEGYGTEDIDYCFRARRAGFKVGIAHSISVQHGVDGKTYGSTFIRTTGEKEMAKQDAANRARFAEKWGLPNDDRRIFEAIRTLQGTEQK